MKKGKIIQFRALMFDETSSWRSRNCWLTFECWYFFEKVLKKVQIRSDFFQPIWNKMRSLHLAICNSIVKSCRFAKPISSLVVQPRKCAYYLHFAMLTLKMKQIFDRQKFFTVNFLQVFKTLDGGDGIGQERIWQRDVCVWLLLAQIRLTYLYDRFQVWNPRFTHFIFCWVQ